MKNPFLLIFIFGSLLFKSQTNRFFYELQSRKDSTEDYRRNIMVLDINPKSIKFYDKNLLDYDSINKNNKNGFSSRTNTKTDQLIIRKPGSFQNSWYRDFMDYFVINSKDEISWKLYPEIKTYNNYKLQKATTNFGGRSWTAWFAKDINIPEGPYKFRGLPGLIFLLEDSNKDFIYALAGNKKLSETYDTSDFLEQHYNKKAMPATRESFNKYLVEIYNNPIKSFTDQVKNGNTVSFKNEEVKNLDELNRKKTMMQKMIKERYIYIEKDNAPIFN